METTVKPCRKCGSIDRNASGKCRPCQKARSIKWAVDNRKRLNILKAKWRNANPEIVTKSARKWAMANPEKIKERNAKWSKENPEKVKAKSIKWCAANVERAKATRAKWKKEHPEMSRAQCHKRRAIKLTAGGTFTSDDIKSIMKQQEGKCAVCETDIYNKYHIDHIMPLALGGSNEPENIQLLCPYCNLSKGAKHPDDFMAERMQI